MIANGDEQCKFVSYSYVVPFVAKEVVSCDCDLMINMQLLELKAIKAERHVFDC